MMFMGSQIEGMIGIFAHSGKTDDFAFGPLLIAHTIDPTQAIACGSKADHTTNPVSELLNVIEAPSTGSPTKSLAPSADEKMIQSQIPDIFGNECVDHGHCISNFRDGKIAS